MHCKRCKNKVSQYAKICPYCHARLEQHERATRQYMKMLTENKFTHSDKHKKIDKKMGVAFLSALVAVSILLISYKDRRNQWTITDQTVFYLQEDGLSAKNLKTGEKRKISDLSKEKEEEKYIANAEGQTFYYQQEKNKLYYAKNVTEKEEQVEYDIYEQRANEWGTTPVRVAAQVRLHAWDDWGNLYYSAVESRLLYKYDGLKTSSIQVPLIKEIHEIEGTGNLFLIGYEPRQDARCYDYLTYDETDGLVFYILDTETFTAIQLFDKRVESYAYTEDGRELYYQIDNVLYEYDLVKKQERIFEKNVYEFLLINDNETEKLYYISYQIEARPLYEFVKDPFKESDEKVAKSRKLLNKERKKDRSSRLSREQFRKQLKQEVVYLFKGTLYQYQDGKKEALGDKVSMLDSLYRSMITYEPFVYKEKEINFGSYELKKEGMEDVGSVYDMVVNLVDGQMRNYDINYETLYLYRQDSAYPEKCEVLMCCKDAPYKVQKKRLVLYDADNSDENVKSCVHRYGNTTYYVSWYHDYTLFEEKDGKSRELLKSVEAYQVLRNGEILALSFDEEKGDYLLYYIDKNRKAQVIDTKVTALVGTDVWMSKGWE